MGSAAPEVYAFGEFELNALGAELQRRGKPVRIFPRAFDVLLYLVRNRDRVVPRDELLGVFWPGVKVTAAVLTQTVWELRRALDDAGDSGLIRNSRGRGYRFVGELAEPSRAAVLPESPDRSAASAPFPSSAPHAQARRATAPRAIAYLGRELEMQRLRVALDFALEGRGSVHLLGGESGIGKTRVAEEVLATARDLGTGVFEGRCAEGQGGPPFWPWLQIVRRIVDETPASVLRECMGSGAPDLCRFCPELRALMRDVPEPPERPADQDRFYVLDSVANFLVRYSQARAVVLMLDDLQWADRPSLLLLESVARMTARARVLVVGTYRTTELREGDPFSRSLAALVKSCDCALLSGLTERQVEQLLAAEAPALDARVAAQVHRITTGNPLFVIQIARLLASDERTRRALEGGQLTLPDELREVIGRRIAQLPAECVELLRWAAALGQCFRLADLRRATARDHEALLTLLARAVDARIVVDDQLGAYRFGHPLIREALHQSLRVAERAQLHLRIGEAIEALCGGTDPSRLDELAYHFCEAALLCPERALAYAERAAQRALEATAFETAAEYYTKALAALELGAPLDAVRAADLRIARAQALRGAGEDPARVRSDFEQVAALAAARGDAQLLSRAALAYCGLGRVRMRLAREAGIVDAYEITLLEQALAALPEDDAAMRVLLLGQLALALSNTRDRARSEQLSSASVEMARRLADPNTLAEALRLRHAVITAPDRLDERLALTSAILTLTSCIEQKGLELDAHVQRAFLFLQKCELAAAEAEAAAAARVAEAIQQPDEKDGVRAFELLRMFWEGRFDQGERESLLLMQRRVRRGMGGSEQAHAIRVLYARWLQGRAGEVLEPLIELTEKYPLPPVWRCALGAAYAVCDRAAEARRELERLALHDFDDLPFDHNWLGCHLHLSQLCHQLGDAARARRVHDALLPYGDRLILLGVSSMYAGPAAHPLGVTALTLGQLDEAVEWFEQAVARSAALGAVVHVALSQLELASALLQRADSGDRARARDLLESVIPAATTLGLGDAQRRAPALLARSKQGAELRARPRRRTGGPDKKLTKS